MRIYDIIVKKRDKIELEPTEIDFVIAEYTAGKIPDYQMSAFLMAVYFSGMTNAELARFTIQMANSGDIINLSAIDGIKVDKHSTGGVGDATTLAIVPIVAACGVKVAKMSGRGLGHTGGTIDKLKAIPGFREEMTQEQFFKQVNEIGLSIISQSGNLAPADKKMYALRDVTATVSSIPLIASSIMSKKLASGCDCILLDVKVGCGAFMKTFDEAVELAKVMVDIGEKNNRRTAALITNMDIPLSSAVGNMLEVLEVATVLGAIECTKELYPQDLHDICIELSARMLVLAEKGDLQQCRLMAQEAVNSGAAYTKLCEMVAAQGGDIDYLSCKKRLPVSEVSLLRSPQKGYIVAIDAEKIGIASMLLGAGRETIEDDIDYAAGIILYAKLGDVVDKDDTLAALYANDSTKIIAAQKKLLSAYTFGDVAPKKGSLILAYVDKKGVQVI